MPAEQSPISTARLTELSYGDREFEAVLMSAFVEEMAQQLTELDAAIAQADAHALKHTAHNLKGAAANVGADETRAIATVLEQVDLAMDAQAARELVGQLRAELERVRVFTQQYAVES